LYRDSVISDKAEGIAWLEKAAKQYVSRAAFLLAKKYLNGIDVPQDDRQCARWSGLLAREGYADGMLMYGILHRTGVGVPKNLAAAFKWFRKAAKGGYAPGQCGLGECYEHGHGVSKDLSLAYAWYCIAAAGRNYSANQSRIRLEKKLTPQQLSKAESLKKKIQAQLPN
jgi:TPR repeat protein